MNSKPLLHKDLLSSFLRNSLRLFLPKFKALHKDSFLCNSLCLSLRQYKALFPNPALPLSRSLTFGNHKHLLNLLLCNSLHPITLCSSLSSI